MRQKSSQNRRYLIIGSESLDSYKILQFRPSEAANKGPMSKDMAMKTLGLLTVQGQGQGRPKTLSDYSEDDILHAFQKECKTLGKEVFYYKILHETR